MTLKITLSIILSLSLIGCKTSPISPSDPTTYTKPIARPCLQTGFNAPVDQATLLTIRELGFEVIRIDAQKSSIADTQRYIFDAIYADLEPLTIVRDAEQLSQLPSGLMYELRNEPDLEGPPPTDYVWLMAAAAEVAKQNNQILYVGAVSNLNDRGFNYLKALRPFPENVRISVHRYGDGTFKNPHKGFNSRSSEVKWLRDTIAPLRFAVTEFGYPSFDLSEEEQAKRVRQELEFWGSQTDFACVYQLYDGPGTDERFGIRRMDGSWKPSSKVVNNLRISMTVSDDLHDPLELAPLAEGLE